jgi:hypothetical protein
MSFNFLKRKKCNHCAITEGKICISLKKEIYKFLGVPVLCIVTGLGFRYGPHEAGRGWKIDVESLHKR